MNLYDGKTRIATMTRFFVVGLVLSMSMISNQVWAAVDTTLNTWIDLPNTKLSSVCPTVSSRPELFGPGQTKDCSSVTAHYVFSSGWDETNQRMIIGGGGHASYYSDEPYGINIETSTITQMAAPISPALAAIAPSACGAINAQHPGGRHWNNNATFMDHLGLLVLVGGAGPCNAGGTAEDLFTFDPSTREWTQQFSSLRATVGYDGSSNGGSAGTVYDKARQRVWFHDCNNIYEYAHETHTVTAHRMTNSCAFNMGNWYTGIFIYDPVRSRYVGFDEGTLVYANVGASGNYTWVSQATSGATSCLGTRGPGWTYDSFQDRYVCWPGGNTVYLLNPTTSVWTTVTLSGTAPKFALMSGAQYGQGSRLQYSKKCNCFVFYGDWQQDAYAFRLTDGGTGGGGGGSDTTPPSVPGSLTATAALASQINLTWAASTDSVGVAGYTVYRNGIQVGTAIGTSYSDQGLTASTTYVYTVAAYDTAGNRSNQSSSSSATTLAQSTGGADFQSRCNTPGVIKCRGWDTAAEVVPAVYPAPGLYPAQNGQYYGKFDSTTTASGAGSLRFDVNGGIGANMAGNWWESFGREFAAGDTFYIQWRQRFSSEMITHSSWTGQGWKQVTVHNRSIGSCAGLELTVQNSTFQNFGFMYTDCGGNNVTYGIPGGDVINQYSNAYPPGSDGTIYCRYSMFGNPANKCMFYKPDQWMTFYLRVTIGTFGTPSSTLQAWAGYEGQPLIQYVNRTGYRLNLDTPGLGFDVINLTPYNSLDSGNPHSTGYTWYDDLIISTQPIPPPSGGGTANPPPAAPTNLRVQ